MGGGGRLAEGMSHTDDEQVAKKSAAIRDETSISSETSRSPGLRITSTSWGSQRSSPQGWFDRP